MDKDKSTDILLDGGNEIEITDPSTKSGVHMEVELGAEDFKGTEESILDATNPEIDSLVILKKSNSEKSPEKIHGRPPDKSGVKKDYSVRYRPLHLPLARIKQIIKMDPDVHLAGSEAVFLIAKATELFIELLSKDAHTFTVSAKKKTIQKKDVDSAISNTDALIFLDGALDF